MTPFLYVVMGLSVLVATDVYAQNGDDSKGSEEDLTRLTGKIERLKLQLEELTNMTCSSANDKRWENNCNKYQTKCMGPKIKFLELSCHSICNGRVQLKKRFRGKRFFAPTKASCFQKCAGNQNSEVAEFTTGNQCICGSASLRARYFAFVPRRYLACNTSAIDVSILYREDRLQANLTAVGQAYLFYSLDEVSGVENVANKEGAATDAVWTGLDRGRFDCAPLTAEGARALTLFNVDAHRLTTRDNLDFTNSQGFTLMAWIKTRAAVPSGANQVILSTDGSNLCYISNHHAYPNKFYVQSPAGGAATSSKPIVIGSWNHVALMVSANYTFRLSADGDIAWSGSSGSFTQTYRQLFIGSFSNGGNSFDGCLAHAAVFKRDLSVAEVKVVSALFQDEDF